MSEPTRPRRSTVCGAAPSAPPQNFAGGLFLLALAALALYLTARSSTRARLHAMGPAMLPGWLAFGVGACGLALVA